jgi:hypothetical protein
VYQRTEKDIHVAHFLAPINRATEHSPFRRIVGMSVAYQKHHSALQLHICPLNKSRGGNISADALISPMTAAMQQRGPNTEQHFSKSQVRVSQHLH